MGPVTVSLLPVAHLQLPTTFANSSTRLITQGAEALLFQTNYLLTSIPCALKYRPPKPYRHPTLDARLTKHRILSEARVLTRCRKDGVPVPAVYALDEKEGWLMIEWIQGEVLRLKLNKWLDQRKRIGRESIKNDELLKGLMRKIGATVGKMHSVGVVHGDLTTSNIMLKFKPNNNVRENSTDEELEGDVVLIDFGLASQSSHDEDRAVDLYVLERAFGSTHPQAETLFPDLINAYGQSFKEANKVLKRLGDVRMRGRKRSMLG